jgi:hypothetical protein
MSRSFWSALFHTFDDELVQDHRDDPVYKSKVQELIERNKAFEQEQEKKRPRERIRFRVQ